MRRNTQRIIEMTKRTLPESRDLTAHDLMIIKAMSMDDKGDLVANAIVNGFMFGVASGIKYQKEMGR